MRQRFVVEIVDDTPAQSPSVPDPVPTPASVSPPANSAHMKSAPTQASFSDPQVHDQVPPQTANTVQDTAGAGHTGVKPPEQKTPQFKQTAFSTQKPSAPPPSMKFVQRAAAQPPQAEQTGPDMFEARQSEVQTLLQRSQLEAAQQESPRVEQPALTKHKQKEILQSTREKAFQTQLRETKPTLSSQTKIEKFYQSQPEFIEKQAQKQKKSRSYLNAESWRKRFIRTVQLGRKLSVVSAIITFLGVSVAGSAWAVRRDMQFTQEQILSLVEDIESGQITSAKERVELLRVKQSRYTTLYNWSRGALPYVLGEQKSIHLDKLLTISDSGLYVIENGFETYDLLQTGYSQFLGEDGGDSIATLAQVSGELEAVFTDLSALQAELQGLDNPFEIAAIDQVQSEVTASFPELRRAVLSAQQLSYALPDLLGEDGKKQYLVLLQNNAELRPTGGFIGSFGILTVEKGRFVDFRVEDVYEADGQLEGYVAPPPEIVEHLGEAQWYLRDVNWDPDFPTVADQAGWFLNKTVNIDPDGVIGINLHVAQKLLEVTGPIRLVDYDEVITKDNLYERAEMHSEINFFPGSTQKRDFLSAVANQLFTQMMSEDANTLALMQALYESAEESQLLISMESPQATTVLQNLGWTGSVLTPQCPSPFAAEACFVDTVMQVEANVGVNKANQYIERSVRHLSLVGKEQVKHEREMIFTNTADSNAWPEGAYKNYIRLFVPADASLQTVSINGTILDPSAIREQIDGNKRSIGFLVNVPISSTVLAKVEYTVPVPANERSVYALFEQKQSGTSDDEIVHTVEVLGRSVMTVAPEPEIEGRVMKFVSGRTKHQFLAVGIED